MARPEPAARASLAAVIRRDLEAIRRLQPLLERLAPNAAYPACAAVAYALHNFYNALENSFDQISRTFENHIVDPVRWHRELMVKMFVEIPGGPAGCPVRSNPADAERPPQLPPHFPSRLRFPVEWRQAQCLG